MSWHLDLKCVARKYFADKGDEHGSPENKIIDFRFVSNYVSFYSQDFIMMREWLKELWQYRELFYFFAWRDVKIRYKQTVLGALWAVLQPFFTMIVFSLLFGEIVKMPTDGIPYPIFYFAALLPWMYFSTALSQAGNSLASNANLITKIYFPRVILPATPVLVGLIDFLIGALVLVGMMMYYQLAPTWKLVLWPALVVPLAFLALALGMFLSALNVKYRDVKYAVPFLVQLLLFATPIIYPTSAIPDRFHWLISLNPLTGIIEAFRAICVPDRQINWSMLGISNVLTLALVFLGTVYFSKTEGYFSDIV
jgi:lipopolysaccharide transport system permease protein